MMSAHGEGADVTDIDDIELAAPFPDHRHARFDSTDEGDNNDNDQQGTEDDAKKTMTLECPVLPCWDETDDGVPPPCRGDDPACWKVFNHQNQYTNDNLVMIAFGNVGFKYFDRERKFYMAIAMWSTLLSIAFTIAGCFALSTTQSIVLNTYWLVVYAKNTTSGDKYKLHLGLRSLVHVHDPCTPFGCKEDSLLYSCSGDDCWPNQFVDDGLGECRSMAASAAFGAFTTCATLLFALIGTVNRMKFSSDANIQKALGMVTDLFCAFIPQLLTMRDFYRRCYVEIDLHYNNEIDAEVYLGPGYWCYIICLFGACMRALFHWLTPIPGQGNGCSPRLPQSLIDLLDEDGDGEVSWDEMKKGYSKLIAARREKIKAMQLRKEGDWGVAKKNGRTMVRANTDKDAAIDPTRSLSASISFARLRGTTNASQDYGPRKSFEKYSKTRDQYRTKKDYEKQVVAEQPTRL